MVTAIARSLSPWARPKAPSPRGLRKPKSCSGRCSKIPRTSLHRASRRLYSSTVTRPRAEMNDNFDSWLEGELAKGYVSFGAAALPIGAPYRWQADAGRARLFGRFASRAVVVAAVTAAGLATTGVLAAAAVTRSTDPLVWSQHLVNAIATCSGQEAGQG